MSEIASTANTASDRVEHDDGSAELVRFTPLMRGLDRGDLAESRDMTCGVFADDLTIGYVNAAWTAFGRANGAVRAWGLGDRLLDGISGPLRAFHAEHLARVVSDGKPWEHDYECGSASSFRWFRLRVLTLDGGAGLLLVHSLRAEQPRTDESCPFSPELYRAVNGLITQCAHCRRARRVVPPFDWEWVPALVEHPAEGITHGLCELCSAYYYGPP